MNKRLFDPRFLSVLDFSGGMQIVKVCLLTEGKEEGVCLVQCSQGHLRH